MCHKGTSPWLAFDGLCWVQVYKPSPRFKKVAAHFSGPLLSPICVVQAGRAKGSPSILMSNEPAKSRDTHEELRTVAIHHSTKGILDFFPRGTPIVRPFRDRGINPLALEVLPDNPRHQYKGAPFHGGK